MPKEIHRLERKLERKGLSKEKAWGTATNIYKRKHGIPIKRATKGKKK